MGKLMHHIKIHSQEEIYENRLDFGSKEQSNLLQVDPFLKRNAILRFEMDL